MDMIQIDPEQIIKQLLSSGYSCFKNILPDRYLKDELDVVSEDIQKKEEVYIQLKSDYDFVVYIYKLILLYEDRKIGYYEYITDEDFRLVDEYFVLH